MNVRYCNIISSIIISVAVIGAAKGWASSETNLHVVTIDVKSSGAVVVDNTEFAADSPKSLISRLEKLGRAISADGEEIVADIQPAKDIQMKHVNNVLIAFGESGGYKFKLEGREYQLPGKMKSGQRPPNQFLVEVGPSGKSPATGKAVRSGVVMVGGKPLYGVPLSALTEQLRTFKKATERRKSDLIVTIKPEDDTLYDRVVHVLDACTEAGADVIFSIAIEPRDYIIREETDGKNKNRPGPQKTILSTSNKSPLAMPDWITGMRRRGQGRDRQEGGPENGKITYSESLENATKQGEVAAQRNLGICYANGNGVPQDYKKAVYFYMKAAKQGDAAAYCYLGICYANGNGVPQDYKKAVFCYNKAVEQEDAAAQCYLGICYANGSQRKGQAKGSVP